MSFWNSTKIKATRKPHRCAWCCTRIPQGSRAVSWASHWDGSFCSGWMHPECEAASDEAMKQSPGEYIEFGDCTRGRMDDRDLPPQFSETGEMIPEQPNTPTTTD